MRKAIFVLLCFLAVCFGYLGFIEGQRVKGEELEAYVAEALDQVAGREEEIDAELAEASFLHALDQVRACILAVDGSVSHFIHVPDPERLVTVIARMAMCQNWLDEAAARMGDDEHRDRALGTANFFYDGFKQTVFDVLRHQTELLRMLTGERLAEEGEQQEVYLQRQDALREMQKFRDRVELEVVAAW